MQWTKGFTIENKELEDDDLLETINNLCQFILDDIVHWSGDFHDPKSDRVSKRL